MCRELWILKMLSVPRARAREHILRISLAPSTLAVPQGAASREAAELGIGWAWFYSARLLWACRPLLWKLFVQGKLIITIDPSLAHCFCNKGKNPDFIKQDLPGLTGDTLVFWGRVWPSAGQTTREQQRVPTGALKFLDWKAWTECSLAGAGDIFFSYFISAISLRADLENTPTAGWDSQILCLFLRPVHAVFLGLSFLLFLLHLTAPLPCLPSSPFLSFLPSSLKLFLGGNLKAVPHIAGGGNILSPYKNSANFPDIATRTWVIFANPSLTYHSLA